MDSPPFDTAPPPSPPRISLLRPLQFREVKSIGNYSDFLPRNQKGHFKGRPFHRVIKHYVIQGGDSEGLGAAEDWILKEKLRTKLMTSPKHEAYMLGTTKSKQDDKQVVFFITTAPIPDLNDRFIVFGRVVKGQDAVQEIKEVDTDEQYQPKSSIRIINVTLQREI